MKTHDLEPPDDPAPCEVCGRFIHDPVRGDARPPPADRCRCPVCPGCGESAQPGCYLAGEWDCGGMR